MIKKYANGIKKGKVKMVELNHTCKTCIHNNVCRYVKDFEIISNSIVEVAKESVDKEYFQNLVDLTIRCKQYTMQPQQIKANLRTSESAFETYNPSLYRKDTK